MPAKLHPEVEDLLDDLAEKHIPPSHGLTPEASRETLRETFITDEPTKPVGQVRDTAIESPDGEVPIRIYEPGDDGPHPILLYFHGGGWVKGDLDTHDDLCRYFTRELDCVTIGVHYHRAPEDPFPAAAEDCYTATAWAAEHADALGGDGDRLAVSGDSAGGNLAAVVSLMARDRGGPDIAHQLLVYPVTNYDFDTRSYREHGDDGMLTRPSMEWYWEQYLARDLDGRHPYASPLQARDLSDLPPATVITAGHDPLLDEGKAYADRLEEAGVPVTYTEYGDMIHAFVSFPHLSRAQEAREECVDELRTAFGG